MPVDESRITLLLRNPPISTRPRSGFARAYAVARLRVARDFVRCPVRGGIRLATVIEPVEAGPSWRTVA